ncbi:MAG: radical SAM protein [Campylobacterales bacterium]
MLYLCSLSNIKSGGCSEGCKFCAQSNRWGGGDRSRWKPVEEILKELDSAVQAGATGFCLVTTGWRVTPSLLNRVGPVIEEIKKKYQWLKLIGCFGTASVAQLEQLKGWGLDAYNHNLESGPTFYRHLSNRRWEERFKTCENVKEVGLELYSGGIFGVGEGRRDWEELVEALRRLEPEVIPINFFVSNRRLPLTPTHSIQIGLEVIKLFRKNFPTSVVMLAGGREFLFQEQWVKGVKAGANGIIIGNYLTSIGAPPNRDWETILRHKIPVYRPPEAPPFKPPVGLAERVSNALQ